MLMEHRAIRLLQNVFNQLSKYAFFLIISIRYFPIVINVVSRFNSAKPLNLISVALPGLEPETTCLVGRSANH